MKKQSNHSSLGSIEKQFFRTQLVLIISLSLFLGAAGIAINLNDHNRKRDQILRDIANAVVESLILTEDETDVMVSDNQKEYLSYLRDTIHDVDVISVINADGIRVFHTNEELIGTEYDGTMPKLQKLSDPYYITNDVGPSGTQRRAYAAIYREDGTYLGFVLTVSLMERIHRDILKIILIFTGIVILALLVEVMISRYLSNRVKQALSGYEPDVFSAMFRMRDNILESLDEGIIAADHEGTVQFANRAAERILGERPQSFHPQEAQYKNGKLIVESAPIQEGDENVGTISILRDREAYTKLMEDLAGTRYLVDSMRANNHEFTNKLHVILGLIQMEMYDEAENYIQNITVVQREMIGEIMRKIDDPTLAALLIGKLSRASELNVRFKIRENSEYCRTVFPLPGDVLITIIGNLINNALEAMNQKEYDGVKELLFGIYSSPEELVITVEDTGDGISAENMDHIFENGFSTKGDGHGTGLYQVKSIIDRLGGTITVESEEGVGTSFHVSMKRDGECHV
ncbi:MAG: sensor histidine kinase [Lachnospiraceae bacterium]|nr:sensor histidine kinase [Lachnospiraceae bacterium]